MDGVLTAWSETVARMFGHRIPPPPAKVPYDIWESFGVSEKELWAAVNAEGPSWWEHLDEYEWSEELYARLQALATGRDALLVICTSPCAKGHSAMGKQRWMNRFTGSIFRDIVITPHKHLLARPNAVLIDDSPDKVEKFRQYGGSAVLFPRQWNDGPDMLGDALVPYVVDQVRLALTGV
jgi:5'(3')-deoxyribonucleotidase